MTDAILLDTHAWVWLELGQLNQSTDEFQQIRRAANSDVLYIASISLHEVAYGAMRKRINLQIPLEDWFAKAFLEPSPRILPITTDIAAASTRLPADFHGDPADRLLAATAIVHHMRLCTHDKALLRFGRQGIYSFLEI